MRTQTLILAAACALAACHPGFVGTAPQTLLVCDYDALEKHSRRDGPALVAQVYDSVSVIPAGAVVIDSPGLLHSVIAQSIYSSTTVTGTARVTVRFANCTAAPLQLRARTAFLSGSGAPAESASAWNSVFVPPGLTAVYEETSLSRSASGFYVELTQN